MCAEFTYSLYYNRARNSEERFIQSEQRSSRTSSSDEFITHEHQGRGYYGLYTIDTLAYINSDRFGALQNYRTEGKQDDFLQYHNNDVFSTGDRHLL